jgi:hypothetical protein
MTVTIDKIADLQGNVASGGTLRGSVPAGAVLQALRLYLTDGGVAATKAQILADLKAIRGELNNSRILDLLSADLVYLSGYYSDHADPVDSGVIDLNLFRPEMARFADMVGAAWGMGRTTRLSLALEMAAAVTNVDAIEAWYETTAVNSTPGDDVLGDHIEAVQHDSSHGSTGWHEYEYKADASRFVLAHHVAKAAHDITHVRAYQQTPGGRRYLVPECPIAVIEQRAVSAKRTLDTGYFTLDFCWRRFFADAVWLGNGPLIIGVKSTAGLGSHRYVSETVIRPIE